MKKARRLTTILISLSFLFSCAARSQTNDLKQPSINQTANQTIVLRAARLVDVAQGKIVNNPVVTVENGKIKSVGGDAPKDARVIDLGDATILPGLIDAHTHITYHFDENGRFGESVDPNALVTLRFAAENARLTLESGFTTIRNLGDSTGVDVYLRDAIKNGTLPGPRMIVSGLPLTAQVLRILNYKGTRAEQMREFVRQSIAAKVDVIKIFEGVDAYGNATFSAREMTAATEEAHKAGLKVAVHAHEAAAVIAAVEGGCDSIEHGAFLNEEAIKLLAKKRVPLVPTGYLPTHYLESKRKFAFDSETWNFFADWGSKSVDNLKRARRGGVLIVNGSDAVAGYHGHNARETVWMTKSGMTPAEVLRAATLDAAELLGLKDQIGDIKAGFDADIIAVAGNPLDDLANLEKVVFVMKSGKVIKSK